MFYNVYTTPGPPLTRWENVKGTVLTIGFIAVWLVGTLITRNGDWLDKWLAPSDVELS